MQKCKYWRFYKALKPPSCECEYCENRWIEAQKSKKRLTIVTEDCPNPEECEEGCCGYCSEVDDLTEDCVSFMERNS